MSNLDLSDNSFSFFCRLCAMKSSLAGVEIFSNEGMLREIKKKIEICLRFIVDQNDSYPKFVCSDCVCKLVKINFSCYFQFHISCFFSANFLWFSAEESRITTVSVGTGSTWSLRHNLCVQRRSTASIVHGTKRVAWSFRHSGPGEFSWWSPHPSHGQQWYNSNNPVSWRRGWYQDMIMGSSK